MWWGVAYAAVVCVAVLSAAVSFHFGIKAARELDRMRQDREDAANEPR